ncbi:hypothetical protein [Afifella aestuarii]|uniref:hypothetical protein n=1 Tax=Afifella aestuarii TaxID=1909496 RepID=UPI0013E289F4|nr:hypothetical protein [Afifella aestuarii]
MWETGNETSVSAALTSSAGDLSKGAVDVLGDVVLLNRAIYGGADALPDEYLADYSANRDPDDVGLRSDLNVYDRYDLYLAQFGFKTLSSSELGFNAGDIGASETSDGYDQNYTYAGDLYRNNYRVDEDGDESVFTQAGAVALAAIKENDAGNTLYLTFRGTDADGIFADGEAGTGIGQARYYEQLRAFIDRALEYVEDPANDVTKVVVSGHSLGGTVADLFTIYDGARFAAVDGVELEVVALASAGVDPIALTLMGDYDTSIVDIDGVSVSFNTPDWYSQLDHSEDIVRNPGAYDAGEHLFQDPTQAPITAAAVATLGDQIHFEGNRVQFDAPLIDQYAISKSFDTNFLAEHYASFYELVEGEFALVAPVAPTLDYDRYITLNGTNERLDDVSDDNQVNGWNVPIDDEGNYASATDDIFIMGLDGSDTITTGSGDDFLTGGAGDDRLNAGSGDDVVMGDVSGSSGRDIIASGAGDDTVYGGDADDDVNAEDGLDLVFGGAGDDTMAGGAGADTLYGGTGSDLVYGGTANDKLGGGDGDDTLWSGSGDDTLFGGSGADEIGGGSGRDLAFGGLGDDSVYGGDGDDEIWAGAGSDKAYGGAGNDVIGAGGGNDQLDGGDGNDTLYAGEGADTLTGGAGADILYGGSGSDVFVFGEGSGADIVVDFDQDEGDAVDLEGQTATASENDDGDLILALSGGGSVVFVGQTMETFDLDLYA